MIGQLNGTILEKQPPQIVLDVAGVGYEVDVSMQTFYLLPALGEKIRLFTQLVIRDDAHLLFGFASKEERQTFRHLVKVSGIGAKTALGILSGLSSEELAHAIANDDVKLLSSVPGIGKKTAERLIVELRGKLIVSSSFEDKTGLFAEDVSTTDDIVSTLLALGYNEREAKSAVKHVPAGSDVSDGVRLALQQLMKK